MFALSRIYEVRVLILFVLLLVFRPFAIPILSLSLSPAPPRYVLSFRHGRVEVGVRLCQSARRRCVTGRVTM